jgi:serine/threonine-protein kinase
VRIIRAVASALSVVHTHPEGRILHRDLKPSNILLTADGTPKVADFGLAKLLDCTDSITLNTGGAGTPSYMPPEQISSKNGELGPWSDVYGLGATLYHLLTGHPPYVGETPQETVRQVLSEPLRRPRAIRPEIPMGLEAIAMKCLEKKPCDRYQSMADLVASLDLYARGLADRNTPAITRWVRTKRWARRNRAQLAGAFVLSAVAVGLVAAGSQIALPSLVPSEHSRLEPNPLAELEAELAKSGTVTLVAATGKPRWSRMALGDGQLAESETGDGTFALRTHGLAMLELAPSAGRDRYRVTAHLRHMHANPMGGTVGVYVVGDGVIAPGGARILTSVLAEFSESHSLNELKFPEQAANHGVQMLTATAVARVGGVALMENTFLRTNLPFEPRSIPQPPWRVLTIDVTPEGVELFWSAAGDEPVRAGRINSEEIAHERQAARDRIGAIARTAVPVPDWAPQRSFGICADDSVVAIKNVTIRSLDSK